MKQRIVIAVPHSNTWFLTQTCISALKRNLTPAILNAFDVQIVIIDNSWDNSPSIRGITDTRLGEGIRVINNTQVSFCHSAAIDLGFMQSACHAGALECGFDQSNPPEFFIPMDSDVIIRKPTWLDELLSLLRPSDYAVGDWHHEEFLYPSFGLYRGEAIMAMWEASKKDDSDFFRWGENFEKTCEIPTGHKSMLQGPFSERRGWPEGTKLKQRPSGQRKGPGHYEPGQQFHHWALEAGWTYSICPAHTRRDERRQIPVGTFYGISNEQAKELTYEDLCEKASVIHWWAGTRAVDRINPRAGHPLSDRCILDNMGYWLSREAQWWIREVPEDIRTETLGLIKKYGWMFKDIPDSADPVEKISVHYREGGIPL